MLHNFMPTYLNCCVPQFANVEVLLTFIKDGFGSNLPRLLKREEMLTLSVCTVGFILGIPHVTKVQNGRVRSTEMFFSRKAFQLTTSNVSLHREASMCSS